MYVPLLSLSLTAGERDGGSIHPVKGILSHTEHLCRLPSTCIKFKGISFSEQPCRLPSPFVDVKALEENKPTSCRTRKGLFCYVNLA